MNRPPESTREEAELPPEGSTISVEVALNSRCSSDDDGNPRKFHWGMFDSTKRLSDEQIREIVDLARIPRLTDGKIEVRPDQNLLTFVIDNNATNTQRRWLMVESGMQQQAVGLVCSALGVGTVIRNLGKDGLLVSEDERALLQIRLDAMKPTYDGSYWSDLAPAGRSPWLRGNLPDPVRSGSIPLIAALASLESRSEGSARLTEERMGQLLWAARGRTPHLYKTRPWGLTIPTWGGEQNITSVYVISDNKLLEYVNWKRNRPTHSLAKAATLDERQTARMQSLFPPCQALIVLCKNEDSGRALWEIGYELLNVLLQAHSLRIGYRTILLDEIQRSSLCRLGLNDPVAMLALSPGG